MPWQLLAARSLSRNSQSCTRNALNVSRPTPRSISSFPSLSPCIPPSYPSSYRTPLPNSTNASYMPHLDASASAWHQLRCWSTHTYAILHTPPSMDVDCHPSHCPPSVHATSACPPSPLGFPRSRSVTTRIRRCPRHCLQQRSPTRPTTWPIRIPTPIRT